MYVFASVDLLRNPPGVLVLPGVLLGVLLLNPIEPMERFNVFMGVLLLLLELVVEQFITESLRDILCRLSFCCLRCHLIWGPLVKGASIRMTFCTSLSRLKWLILSWKQIINSLNKHIHIYNQYVQHKLSLCMQPFILEFDEIWWWIWLAFEVHLLRYTLRSI